MVQYTGLIIPLENIEDRLAATTATAAQLTELHRDIVAELARGSNVATISQVTKLPVWVVHKHVGIIGGLLGNKLTANQVAIAARTGQIQPNEDQAASIWRYLTSDNITRAYRCILRFVCSGYLVPEAAEILKTTELQLNMVLRREIYPALGTTSLITTAAIVNWADFASDPPPTEVSDRQRIIQLVKNLTARELQVLQQLATGANDEEIANAIGSKAANVGTHKHHMKAKLGSGDAAVCVRMGIQAGYVPLPASEVARLEQLRSLKLSNVQQQIIAAIRDGAATPTEAIQGCAYQNIAAASLRALCSKLKIRITSRKTNHFTHLTALVTWDDITPQN